MTKYKMKFKKIKFLVSPTNNCALNLC